MRTVLLLVALCALAATALGDNLASLVAARLENSCIKVHGACDPGSGSKCWCAYLYNTPARADALRPRIDVA